MNSSLLRTPTLPLLQQAARFHERRQDAIASNIANIETPGYKTRDLPQEAFQQAMQQAVQSLSNPPQAPSANPFSHFPLPFPDAVPSSQATAKASLEDLFQPQLFQIQTAPPSNITFNDGNNRSIENEIVELQKTVLQQNYAIQLMQAQYSMLQTAISERV